MKYIIFVAACAVSFIAALGWAKPVQASPPAGFQANQIIGSGLNGPSGFDIAPDGRIFILERTGNIWVYKGGQLLSQPFVVLPSAASGDRGLIGIAFDPNFNTNHWVYFYYTSSADLHNYLVRFDASGDTAANGPVIIYQTPDQSFSLHVGGTIRFGPDGKIYLSIGDNGTSTNAQDLSNAHGKILRINSDGTIPSDNPFVGQSGKLPEIWAYGFRNPFRFQFDSATGRLYAGDVGEATWEEEDLVVKGGNYGWPICEGPCTNTAYIAPIFYYNHNGGSAAIMGGPVYHGNMFPAAYQGTLFVGDYAQMKIRNLVLDANGNVTSSSDFDPTSGSIVDMKVAADGSIYYITYLDSRLMRITYSTGNQIPVATATANPTSGPTPLTVNFSSAGTFDPDGNPLSYTWNFGDGTTSNAANPQHIYQNKGTYTVQLFVSDGQATGQAAPLRIQAGTPPTVNITSPASGVLYKAGDAISYSATGTDASGAALPSSAFSTQVLFHHQTHIHPFLGPIAGSSGQFAIPTTGEPSPDTWFEILITGTDSNNLSTTVSRSVFPQKSNMTFASSPAGFQFFLDGAPQTAPLTVQGVVGFQRTISAPSSQASGGATYFFSSWSDGGAQTHTITTPATDATFTENFQTGAAPVCGTPGTGTFTGCYYNDPGNGTFFNTLALTRTDAAPLAFDWGGGSPDVSVQIDNFSARWSGNFTFAAGTYTFTTTADDGVRIYVDGTRVIDKWIDQPPTTYTYTAALTAGTHLVTMEYYERGGGAVAKLSWVQNSSGPTCGTPGTGTFTGCYYNDPGNGTFFNTLALTRTDAAPLAFDWGAGSPDPSVQTDNFSARWQGSFTFAAGTYAFTTTADDGVRLYIDNNLVIDKWIDQPSTTYTVSQTLTAGSHLVRLEYFEHGGGAVAKLAWSAGGTAPACGTPGTGTFTGCYYNDQTLTNLVLTRTDSYPINFDWGGGSPDPAVPVDHFSARWSGNFSFNAASYAFTVTGDDGIRLYIDGTRVLDKWIDQPATTYIVNQNMTAGTHLIVLEYYENSGGAVAKLSWVQNSSGPTCGTPGTGTFTGCYYNDPGNGTFFNTLALTRTDAAPLAFDWGAGSPDPSVQTDNFSARWQGSFTFAAGTYAFTTTADDGVRLYIDNNLVIDKWIDQPSTTYTVSQTLTAGSHLVRLEYFEHGGGAVAKLAWQ